MIWCRVFMFEHFTKLNTTCLPAGIVGANILLPCHAFTFQQNIWNLAKTLSKGCPIFKLFVVTRPQDKARIVAAVICAITLRMDLCQSIYQYPTLQLWWEQTVGVVQIPHVRLCWMLTLTHWDRDKMAAIFQTTFLNAFSWIKMNKFRFRFHWRLFPRVQLTIFQHWCR